MYITKLAQRTDNCRRPYYGFRSARSAFKALLRAIRLAPSETVLLPAYIGWSPREGSGVFDPVTELGLGYRFYRMDERLTIDLDHLRDCLAAGGVRLLVLIHYFGYVDPGYREAVALAREHGVLVLEDEAHALFTDLVGGAAGRLGDVAIFSLHKMLPVESGGMLVLNDCRGDSIKGVALGDESTVLPWEFDLHAAARRRVENARRLEGLLAPYRELLEPLRWAPREGEVPQTLPVVVRRGSRDRLYQRMNESGFGVVTLYHTLIDRIEREAFPEVYRLSKRILNLPVHQDAEADMLERMVETLVERILASAAEQE